MGERFLSISMIFNRKRVEFTPGWCNFNRKLRKTLKHDSGDLVCCDTCPGCYHEDCIQGKLGYIDPKADVKVWRCPD